MYISHKEDDKRSGYLLVLVMVFGSIFFLMVVAFVGYVVTQIQVTQSSYSKIRAFNIAEAGLDYYKWFLAHYPDDITNGTGVSGPYVHVYSDPEGDPIGEFSLEIESTTMCGDVYSVDITSTGHTYDNPNIERILYGRYAQPTVAEYAYIINSNVWAGADRTIVGPYHSNGVIRMDGTNNSTVSSGQENWVCDGSMSCSPGSTGSIVDGVYGDGPNNGLWTFPSPPINFTGITVDLAVMQDKAQNGGGIYLGPSGDYGYRLHFNSDGTVSVYVVDRTYYYWGYNSNNGWQSERNVIEDDDFLATYTIPSACSVIYVEDKVWLEGEINGKVTLAVADINTMGVDPSIILNDNITYANATSGILATAEGDVLVGLVVPDSMELNGIFIAQNGRFGRNHYTISGSRDVLSMHNSYVTRDTLVINGTIVSNGRVGTKWTSGGTFISGFDTRFNSYDRDLVSNPPPLTPSVSDTYKFIEWREVE